MFSQIFKKRSNKSEGESPFWISFSDLMTALMTLFLVVMAVTLISIQKSIPESIAQEAARQEDIRIVMGLLKTESTPFSRVKVDEANFRLDLGDVVYFESNSSSIKPEVAAELRAYIPTLLKVKKSDKGKWIKRFIVEGFTDQDGTDTAKAQQAITAIRKALASQPAQQQEQGRQIDQLIKERDHRDEIIDKLCDAVLGPDLYEWSSQYFFEDAVREVEERMAALEQPAQQQGWKLVPIDANDTMIDAFENFIGRDISGFRQAYQAMLNAAPQPAHQEPDLSWLKPETQKKIRQWLADGSFAERAIGVIDAQEKALMRYEAQQQEHEQQHTRDAETELNCAEEVLDGYAAHLEHQDTAFNRIGDYLKEVCEALKERPAQQEHLEHTSVRRSGPQM